MGLPESEPRDPTVRLEHAFRLTRRRIPVREWVDIEAARGRLCACGCGDPIRIAKRHRRAGVPTYRHGHHPGGMTKDVQALRAKGYMTSTDVAKALGIGVTTLLRLMQAAHIDVARVGGRKLRAFTRRDLGQVRKLGLQVESRTGPKSSSFS
jgi:hypothetical protein